MSRTTNGILITLFLSPFLSMVANGATYPAASCTQSAVQAAINSAVSGDTVIIPAGSCSWTSGVNVAGKAITITGQGSGRIIAYSADSLTVGTGSKTINIQSGLSITNGQTLRISQTGGRGNWMQGTVTSYSGSTLTMNITSVGGNSTARRWLVSTTPITTITNNSGATLFSITEDTVGHTNISGIKVAQGTGGGDVFQFNRNGSGGRAILLHDCWIEQGSGDSIWSNTNRGVVRNCSFDASPFSMAPLAFHHQADNVTNSWTTASTMGTADSTGEGNLYFENNDFHAYLNSADIDNNGRAVFRYNLFNNAGFGTHGPDTSNYGQRHFQFYNNTGIYNAFGDGSTFPMNWWFFIRGGTFVIANNVLPALNSTDYPNKPDLNITVMNLQRSAGPNPCWGAGTSNGARYNSPRQAGSGYVSGGGHDGLGRSNDSITYVGDSEPGYVWGNSRSAGSPVALNVGFTDFGECSNPDRTQNYVVSGRDFFNSASTAKPGWTPYTYPHPLLSGAPPPPIDTTPPSTPTNLSATAVSSSQVSLSWTASTDNVGVAGYRVERCQGSSCSNFAQVGTASGASYSDTGLTANTIFRYRVRAADAAVNLSGYSGTANATTQSAPSDTTPPTTPTNVSAAAASASQINLSWTAVTDNVGVTGYRVERCLGASCSNFGQVATPTSASYSDIGLTAGTAYRYRVRATDAAGNFSGYSATASATTLTGGGPATLPSGNTGISAAYPGDSNIRSHPDVIFADDFESYSSANQLTNNWNDLYQQAYTRIATEAGNVFSGNRALEFRVPQQSAEVANEAVKNLSPAEDTVFVRAYTKFESGYNAIGSSHNGLSIRAQYCCPGVPANGTNKFQVGLENSHEVTPSEPTPGYTKVYIYHPEQRSQWGDLWYPDGMVLPFSSIPGDFGPSFVPRPNFNPQLNRWYSYEFMVKANTPGQRDGRVAVWIDGNLVADFLNVRLRDVSSLKIDKVVLSLHIGSNTARQNLKWYDNVVIARSYIGPMSVASSVVPPTNLSATVQ